MKAIELHIFADASELAFGAVGYTRTIYCDGSVWCCMLFPKSRLAPIKTLTIPRLELQAAVLAVRVKNTIIEEIKIQVDLVCFWSDSTITLQYINNETKRFKTFVANRVAEIREHSHSNQWNFIKGEENPADALTRGLSVSRISATSRWVQGPEFLSQKERDWPTQDVIVDLSADDVEIRTVASISYSEISMEEFERYSSWWKLLNVVGWLLRFVNRCRKNLGAISKYLTLKELHNARNVILRMIQRKYFSNEYKLLANGESLSPSSPLLPLCPCLDSSDGLIRVGGRVKRARIPYAAKHQIILPSKNHLVTTLVTQEHRMNIDCGPNQLLCHLQGNYWILGGKKLIKRVQRDCLECRKRKAKPQAPLMADLPDFRVDLQTPVFYNTGVDFFGPISTKLGRRTQKRWGALFTCLVTRAIHLEVAEALSTDAFINVLERFINRRGNPKRILSDCGSNFKGADKELVLCLKELEQGRIAGFSARKSIEWIFNPPEAPHMGGVWERLVRSVKIPLQTILKDRTLTDLQLATVFTEAESLVNSRPLTAISENPNDLEALTPNHFILGHGSPNLPFNAVYDTDKCSRKRWKEVQFLTQHFWRRWIKEYLPQLTIRHKWRTESRNMKKGDIVLLVDNNASRGMWRLGRIVDVHPGKDDRVRVVQVKTKDGVYTRPVTKLCLLEEDQTVTDDVDES